MSFTLFSPSWYLVKDMTIRLRSHVRVERHVYREHIWYVLQDSITGHHHRVSSQAYEVLGRLDGETILDAVWLAACDKLDEDMPTQDDVISLLSKLFRASLLHADRVPDIFELSERKRNLKHRRVIQQLKSPLGIKVPLLDPDAFLNRTQGYVVPLFSRWGATIWLVVVLSGLLLAGTHWTALTTNLSDRMLALGNVFLLMCIYPVVKAIHELGHAYVIKKWGGEVHEIGIMFLVFFPVPYVEASAASVFPNKYHRMLVGAAGVLVELFIAAIAMIVWVLVEPGLVRALAYNTMMIAGISTVFFNGNPLLKFDAYYVLADYLEIPNLASRANQQVGYLMKRYVLGVKDAESLARTWREAMILLAYAVAAFCYRMIIMLIIALFIASQYFFLGFLLAAWSIYAGLFGPLTKALLKPLSDPQLQKKKSRTWLFTGFAAAGVLAILFVIPLPKTTHVHGVFWVDEDDHVRAQNEGFVDEVHLASTSTVQANTPLVSLSSPELQNRVQQLAAATEEAEARLQSNIVDRSRLAVHRELVAYSREEQARMKERLNALTISSQGDGVFIIPDAENLPQRFVMRGESLGYLVDFDSLPVTTMVREDNIHAVRDSTKKVEVRLASNPTQVYEGVIQRLVPASTRSIPSEVLTVDGGGEVVLDPQSAGDLQSIEPYFHVVIGVPGARAKRLNERAYVLFHHPPEPLGYRLFRALRRVFLRQLDV